MVWECLGMFVISHDFPVFPSTSLNPRRKWQQTFRNMLHPVAICGPQGSRDERHEHGWRDQGDWFQRSATCSLSQQWRWLSRHLFHSISSIHFHYFFLFQIVPHDIPSHSSNLDTTWWKLTEHDRTLSTYVHILVLSFFLIVWFYSSISSTHPILRSLLWHVWVVHGFSGAIWGYVQKDAEGLIMNFESFWYVLIL